MRCCGARPKAFAARGTGGARLTVNGETRRRALIRSGDILTLGTTSISILPAPAGFDFALLVETTQASSKNLESDFRTSLQDTGIAKRLPAWGMALAVLMLFLALPALNRYLAVDEGNALSAILEDIGLPAALEEIELPAVLTDSIWSTGDVHPSHAAGNTECSQCHEKLFQRVADPACINCHETITEHVAVRDTRGAGAGSRALR